MTETVEQQIARWQQCVDLMEKHPTEGIDPVILKTRKLNIDSLKKRIAAAQQSL